MSKFKRDMIRLGSKHPELRPHIRKILAHTLPSKRVILGWLESASKMTSILEPLITESVQEMKDARDSGKLLEDFIRVLGEAEGTQVFKEITAPFSRGRNTDTVDQYGLNLAEDLKHLKGYEDVAKSCLHQIRQNDKFDEKSRYRLRNALGTLSNGIFPQGKLTPDESFISSDVVFDKLLWYDRPVFKPYFGKWVRIVKQLLEVSAALEGELEEIFHMFYPRVYNEELAEPSLQKLMERQGIFGINLEQERKKSEFNIQYDVEGLDVSSRAVTKFIQDNFFWEGRYNPVNQGRRHYEIGSSLILDIKEEPMGNIWPLQGYKIRTSVDIL